jgi:hemerythrin-like domain-containing protein
MPQEHQSAGHDPYAVLAREHRLIERGLAVLARICDEVRRTKKLNAQAAAEAIRFLREFADRTHHLKEEEILFPAIEARTVFPGCGLISEHKEGRERVRGMAEAVERYSRGDSTARSVFVRKARSYIDLLRAHIAKEDDCLAGTVERAFAGEEREALTREFEELERREIGERAFERFAAVIEALETTYGAADSHDPDDRRADPNTP